jgi:hypothetical protein
MQLTREYQQLAYANRLLNRDSSQPSNPAHSLLIAGSSQTGTSDQLLSKPFWQQLSQLQSDWNVDPHTTNGLELKRQMIQRQLQLYQQTPPSTSSPGLRPYKTTPGTSLYLYLDPKPIAAMRAKFRFDLASLRGSVMGHRMDTASEACVLCDEPTADTRHHLLLHCPIFYRKRRGLVLNLMSDGDDHLVNSDSALISFLLGNLPSSNRHSDQNRYLLKQTGQFIQLVFAHRFRSFQQL